MEDKMVVGGAEGGKRMGVWGFRASATLFPPQGVQSSLTTAETGINTSTRQSMELTVTRDCNGQCVPKG